MCRTIRDKSRCPLSGKMSTAYGGGQKGLFNVKFNSELWDGKISKYVLSFFFVLCVRRYNDKLDKEKSCISLRGGYVNLRGAILTLAAASVILKSLLCVKIAYGETFSEEKR